MDVFRNRLWCKAGRVQKDPISHAAGEERFVRRAKELVLASGGNVTAIGDPRADLNCVADECLTAVFNLVPANNPYRIVDPRGSGAANSIRMCHGGILHPSDEFDIVNMPVGIDG